METSLIINGLKSYLGFKKDADLAKYLGIKNNTLANWKARNTVDVELIISKCDFVNPAWLLTGEGNMLKEDNSNPINKMDDHKLTSHLMNEVEYLRKRLDESEAERKELRAMYDRMIEETKELRNLATNTGAPKKKEAI